jgi:hypothetical protein
MVYSLDPETFVMCCIGNQRGQFRRPAGAACELEQARSGKDTQHMDDVVDAVAYAGDLRAPNCRAASHRRKHVPTTIKDLQIERHRLCFYLSDTALLFSDVGQQQKRTCGAPMLRDFGNKEGSVPNGIRTSCGFGNTLSVPKCKASKEGSKVKPYKL